jgi:hypothetical protein
LTLGPERGTATEILPAGLERELGQAPLQVLVKQGAEELGQDRKDEMEGLGPDPKDELEGVLRRGGLERRWRLLRP